MTEAHSHSTQSLSLSTSHADVITCLAFSSSAPSLLASTSLDGWIRIHARASVANDSSHPSTTARQSTSGAAKGRDAGPGNGTSKNGRNGKAVDDEMETEDESSPPQDEWIEVGACKANEGPVWKAIWGPREYGTSLLVSIAGSVVHVWETQVQQGENIKLGFIQRASLIEARGSLRDIAFAPSAFGLKLASIAADSRLRIYECLDPSSSGLATWSLLEDIDLLPLPYSYYSPGSPSSQQQAQTQTQLIKGFDDQASSSSGDRKQLGPSGGSSGSLNAQAMSNTGSGGSGGPKGAGKIESSGAWALAYCQEAWWGECLAVSAGREGVIRIVHFSPPSYWQQVIVLSPSASSTLSPIATLAWAPSSGRSYHLIAAGTRDGSVRIWKVTPPNESSSSWDSSLAADITDHMDGGSGGGIGRVEWNITGTVLSTAGCDGVVRLWKATYSGEWRALSQISCEAEREEPASNKQSRR